VTKLRSLTLEEIQRRNFTESTRRANVRIIENFARHFNLPPDQLGPDHIREYVAHLFRDKKLSDNSVTRMASMLPMTRWDVTEHSSSFRRYRDHEASLASRAARTRRICPGAPWASGSSGSRSGGGALAYLLVLCERGRARYRVGSSYKAGVNRLIILRL
jgi:hypothetical protein